MGNYSNKNPVFKAQNSEFIATNVMNDVTFDHYLRTLKKLCLTMFEWNVPKGMDSRFLEEVLYYNGMASFLKSNKYGFINTACCYSGDFNIYGLPSKLNCFSYGFSERRKLYTGLKNESAKDDSCILVWNCQDKESTFLSMELFAYRLYMADRCMDININGIKTPIVILADDKTKLSMINAYAKYDGNAPVIVGKKNQFNPQDFTSIDTRVEFIADKVQDYKKVIWNEVLTFLGINNIDTKKERLITDEANQNNEVINLNLQSFYTPRKKAAQQFNDLFGDEVTIDVKLRSDLANVIKKTESIITNDIVEEGDEE